MALWTIGELPQGWERGSPLGVINANYREGKMIGLQRAFTRRIDATVSPAAFDVSLHFHYTGRYKVLAWLRWYFDVPKSKHGRLCFAHIAKQIR